MKRSATGDPPGTPSASQGSSSGGGTSEGPASKKRIVFEPIQLGPIANLEELEVKTLAFQNQKLGHRLTQRIAMEEELRSRIDQLEKRQTQDDALINIIHRYWNQLNEDIRVLLQRFDAETCDDEETSNENSETTSFITQLATWQKQELDEKLASRVQVSQRAVAKIIQVFDHLNQRHERLSRMIRGEDLADKDDKDKADDGVDKSGKNGDKNGESRDSKKGDSDESMEDDSGKDKSDKDGGKVDGEEECKGKKCGATRPTLSLDEEVKELNRQLIKENQNLHRLNTKLHESSHFQGLRQAEFDEKLNAEETKNEELQNKVDDHDYELTKARMRNGKLETTLGDAQEKLKMYVDQHGGKLDQKVVLSNAERKTVEQLNHDHEEQRELAATRLAELESTNSKFKESLKEVEKLRMELSTLPGHVVVETTEHKCLQSQFSVLYNEAMQLKTQLEESRAQLQSAKNTHMRQIEQMEAEELLAQKKLRTEVIQLEDMLAQVRKEYEMLRIEFEQNLAANEQTGPINKEMRNLITSLRTHNVQLKGEVARYKRKCKESSAESAKLRKDLDDMKTAEIKALQAKKLQEQQQQQKQQQQQQQEQQLMKQEPQEVKAEAGEAKESSEEAKTEDGVAATSEDSEVTEAGSAGEVKKEEGDDVKGEPGEEQAVATAAEGGEPVAANDEAQENSEENAKSIESDLNELKEKIEELTRGKGKDAETIKELKVNLKKAQNDLKEMKLLLDMYKACTKEQREKAAIMVAEKKARAEAENLQQQLKKLGEAKKEEKKRLADEDATRRIKQLEEQCASLNKQLANHKQEEEALLSDMEVTGQAFEDMQEQNSRLIQQLREKDDANLKLMSERIKSNQIQRLAREERDMLIQQVNTLSTQVEAQNQVVRKLEEKERLLQTNLMTVEKELAMRQQAMEMHKRKAIESAQSAADLKLHLEKYHAQIKEVQQTVAEKTSSLEAEAFKTKRLHEELVLMRRKVERLRKIEMASDMDEILKEEIREYKETLTCPSCKVKRKDAVLTKCFHCFCYDCLRTRYETRQRKCPKCNAAFGASDYHRLYLA